MARLGLLGLLPDCRHPGTILRRTDDRLLLRHVSKNPSRLQARDLTCIHRHSAVHEHVINAFGVSEGLLEGRDILH
jgi:hypothetical protein